LYLLEEAMVAEAMAGQAEAMVALEILRLLLPVKAIMVGLLVL
jgi:hypothetical protein